MTEFIRWLFFHKDSVSSCKKFKKIAKRLKMIVIKKKRLKKIVKRLRVNNRMNSVVMQMRPSRQF